MSGEDGWSVLCFGSELVRGLWSGPHITYKEKPTFAGPEDEEKNETTEQLHWCIRETSYDLQIQ